MNIKTLGKKAINIKIDKELHRRFRIQCVSMQKSMGEIIINLMTKFVEENEAREERKKQKNLLTP